MDYTTLMDKRSYFIGDRIALSQIYFLLKTGITCYLIEILNLADFCIDYLWWLFLLLLPIPIIIVMAAKIFPLYFDYHWSTSFLLFSIIWASFTIYLGLLVDNFFGYGNAFWVSLIIGLIYSSGYYLAKIFRILRHSLSKDILVGLALGLSTAIITVTAIIGVNIFNIGQSYSLNPFNEFFLINAEQMTRIGIYLIIIGIGIVVSMGFHYFMFYCLIDPKGLDVEEDPPNKLYIRIMIVSFILTFISWILLLVLFPPIAAGGGKKKGKSLGSSKKEKGTKYPRRYYASRYRTYLNYGIEPSSEGYPSSLVDKEWSEHGLDIEGEKKTDRRNEK